MSGILIVQLGNNKSVWKALIEENCSCRKFEKTGLSRVAVNYFVEQILHLRSQVTSYIKWAVLQLAILY